MEKHHMGNFVLKQAWEGDITSFLWTGFIL